MDLTKYIPVADYAKLKNVTVQAVYQRAKRGNLDYKKIGSFTFIKKD